MNIIINRKIGLIALVVILVLMFFTTTIAANNSIPRYIYYENEDSDLVRADYQQAIDDLNNNDPRLRDAIRDKIGNAIGSFRNVFIEDEDGNVYDYGKIIDEGESYEDVICNPDYKVGAQHPDKELIICPITGDPIEVTLDPEVKDVSTASELQNALADEYTTINFIGDITLEDLIPPVDYPVTINLRNHELRLDEVDFRIIGQNVVITAAEDGKIIGENGYETIDVFAGAEVTFKGQNPNSVGVINFENIEIEIENSYVTLLDASFDGADDDTIPLRLIGDSTLDVRDSTNNVEVKTDAILLISGEAVNDDRPVVTGNGLIYGAGRIDIDSTFLNDSFVLDITGDSSDQRLSFDVFRMDINYEMDIDLRLANLTIDCPVWLDNGSGFDYDQLGVKVIGDLDGEGTIRGQEVAFDERLTVLESVNIDGIRIQQLRLDINQDGTPAINVRFSEAEPVTFAGDVDAYIAGSPGTNSFIAVNTVNVEGDLTFIFCELDGSVGSTDNIAGAGAFVGEGTITYEDGTTLTVSGNQLTFDVTKYVNSDIEFARLELLRKVHLAADKTITVTGDIKGDPISYDRGKIIGDDETTSIVYTASSVTFEHMNLQDLIFAIETDVEVNYVNSGFDQYLTAIIIDPATLIVDNLEVLGNDVYVEGSGTFTGNRVFGDDDISFRNSAGLNVQGSSWFTFENPIRVEDHVNFAYLEFKEIIYEVDGVIVTIEGSMLAWEDDQGNIHGVIDGRSTAGEMILVSGNDDNNTVFYNVTLNDLDLFIVLDSRVYIEDMLGSTKHHPENSNIGMDVRGDTDHLILFLITENSSLIINNTIKSIDEAVDVLYQGGSTAGPGAIRGRNGLARIWSPGDNPITIADGSRLLFMGHRETNLDIDARIDIADVEKVKMGIIDLRRRVTNLADNELFIFPHKTIHVHDEIVLQGGDLDILTDLTAQRPPITMARYDTIIYNIQNPVQGFIQGESTDVRIRGANTLTLGNRVMLINLILDRQLAGVEVEDKGEVRGVLTLEDITIEDQKVNFQDYLVWLKSDLRLVKIDEYPELYFLAGDFDSNDAIAILYGEGNKVYGDGGVAFSSSEQKEAVAQNVDFDIASTGFPYEVMILGDSRIDDFEPVVFRDVNWTSQTTVQVGDRATAQYPILRFEVKEQDKNINDGGLRVWKDGATDEDGLEQKNNLKYLEPGKIDYYNLDIPVDAPFFEVEFIAKEDPVLTDSTGNEVEFRVTNVGAVSGQKTVKLYVDGVYADESVLFDLSIGGSATGILSYDAPSDSGDIVLRLETDDHHVEQTVAVVEPFVFFEPSMTKDVNGTLLADGDEVEVGDVIDVEWRVENIGNIEGTQDVNRYIYIDNDLKIDWSNPVTLDVGDVWLLDLSVSTDAGSAQGIGEWKFVLETDDDTYEQIVQVVVPEGQVYNQTQGELYDTIQEAVDDADPDDFLLVGAGTYPENVEINPVDGLTLKSVEKHAAVIEGYVEIQADDVTIEDFHVNYAAVDRSPVDLRNVDGVTIRGNKVEGGPDTGGISTWTGPAVAKGEVLIEDNEIIKGPVGVIPGDEVATITIRNNTMTEPADEGIWVWQNAHADLIIEGNTVTDAGLNDVKIVDEPVSINGENDIVDMYNAILEDNPDLDTVLFEWIPVDADNSSADWTDNGNGTGTMTLTVKDDTDTEIPGLGAITRIEYGGTYYSLTDLAALAIWADVQLVNDYEILFTRASPPWSNTLVWTVSVNAVDIWVFQISDLDITE